MIHIGKTIHDELRRQERSVAWFARQLACDRSNVYRIFERKSMDTSQLYRVAHILNYDFFAILSKHLMIRIAKNQELTN